MDLEELEFDRALAEKRHKELMKVLGGIVIPEPKELVIWQSASLHQT